MQSIETVAAGRKAASREARAAPSARQPEKLAHSTSDAQRLASCGKTTLFKALASGELKYRKLGKKTLILDADLRAWIAGLPIGASRQSAA